MTKPTRTTNLRDRVDAGLDQFVMAVPAATPLVVLGDRALARVRSDDPEAGASVLELVVISAVVLAIVLTVGVIIRTRITEKANQLDLTTPAAT